MLGSELSMFRHQSTSSNYVTKIPNTSFGNLAEFNVFGTIITNQYQIYIRKDIKSRLNSADACYRSVSNLLSIGHLSKQECRCNP
jgi:hypothetical protein